MRRQNLDKTWKGLGRIAGLVGLVLLGTGTGACGETATQADMMVRPLPVGTCTPATRAVADEGAQHVALDSPLTFQSNPPASGSHYPLWGRWGVHPEVLTRGYYVHNLEHGGVALLYRCDTPCPETIAALQAVMDNAPRDSTCAASIKSRLVLTADPLLDTPVAAAAWTKTYRADCVDGPSLLAFIAANYDHGPESLCAEGQMPLD